MDFELAIIGGGPAGFSAGIYAGRAGIKSAVFEKAGGGGLALISPKIENYAGFESITGADLVEKMKKHSSKYTEMHFFEPVNEITKVKEGFILKTEKQEYKVGAVLLCQGSEYRKLGVEGESELQGKGVSYCATCDGFFFKDKVVAVVGGGNSALIESIYLKQIGCKEVYVIHRRDQLRAESAYQKDAIDKGVKIIYNSIVEKINGTNIIESLTLHNIKTDKKTDFPVNGLFVSIGEIPQNELAKKLSIKLDEKGYIVTDKAGRTNVKGVYAAGDITGGLRQVITAAAEGAVAALTSTEVLGKQYPY